MNLPAMPSNPCSRETLRIGGGYNAPALGASPAGGLDIDNAGNCALDGDLTVAGDVSLGGEVLTPALHNGGGAGATGAIASGSYTPTATNDTNCASFTGIGVSNWTRVGQVVMVTARVGVNPTAGSTLTKFRLSLPVPSDILSTANLAGMGGAIVGTSFIGVSLSGEVANNAALAQFTSSGTATHWIFCLFQYEVH